jgi:hypothetical protein
MRELYKTVARHLQAQRDSEDARKLWDDLWAAYEKAGAEGLAEFVESLVELPGTNNDEGA